MRKALSLVIVFTLAFGLFVGCGGGDAGNRVVEQLFENTYEGKYFTIQYPDDYKVEESYMGINIAPKDAPEEDSMNIPASITINDMKAPEFKKGDVSMLKEKTEEEMGEAGGMLGDLGLEEVNFAGYNSLSMKLNFLGMNAETYTIPFDGWTVTIAGTYKDEDKELIEKMLSTFVITNENYEGSESIDYGINDGEDTVDDVTTDDEDIDFDYGTSDDMEGKYEGAYFEIDLPEGAEYLDMGEDGVSFTCDGFELAIMAESESDYEFGNIDYVKAEVEKEIASGEIHTVEDMTLGMLYNAVWFEGDAGDGTDMVVVIVPMQGWMISIFGSGYNDESKEAMKEMVKSMNITDMFYKTDFGE